MAAAKTRWQGDDWEALAGLKPVKPTGELLADLDAEIAKKQAEEADAKSPKP